MRILLAVALFLSLLHTVDALAQGGNRRRAVGPPPDPQTLPSSLGLIRKALEEGVIDDQAALMYQVFAVFEDARLPQQFRGEDSNVIDSLVMADVRARLETLRPEVQAALAPFLVPPIYEGSRSGVGILADPPACSVMDQERWAFRDTANGAVRIWWQKSRPWEGAHAETMRTWIDNDIWPKLVSLFNGRVPESDQSQVCNGGDGKLDIYLTNQGKAIATPFRSCGPTPVYITSGVANGLIGPQTLTHELAHAFQFAYKLSGCLQDKKYRWWGEATAQWTMDHVYPDANGEHRSARDFLDRPDSSLDLFNDAHEYGAYLFAQFLEKEMGAGAITDSWEECTRTDAVTALDRATSASSSGGLARIWPKFVLSAWNREPEDSFRRWDNLAPGAKPAADGPGFDSVDAYKQLPTGLPRLSARYYRFTTPRSARSIAFFNGMKYRLTRAPMVRHSIDYGQQYQIDDAPAEARGGSLQVLIKRNGRWLPVENWTDTKSKFFCLQNREEFFEEIVFIFANSDIDPDHDLKDVSLPSTFITTNFGCRWNGTLVFTAIDPFTFTAGNLKITYNIGRDAAGTDRYGFSYPSKGTAEWRTSGTFAGCTYSGSGTVPIESLEQVSFNFAPPGSSTYRKVFFPAAVPLAQMTATRHCSPAPPQTFPVVVGQFFPPASAGDPFVKLPVSVDGSVIKGEIEEAPIGKWEWEFRAEP